MLYEVITLVKLSKTGQRVYGEAKVSFEAITADVLSNLSQTQLERILEQFAKLI